MLALTLGGFIISAVSVHPVHCLVGSPSTLSIAIPLQVMIMVIIIILLLLWCCAGTVP